MTRLLLWIARKTKLRIILHFAFVAAGAEPSAASAVYFIAVRYFGLSAAGRSVAVRAAKLGDLPVQTLIYPLVEMDGVSRHERVPRTVAVVDAMLDENCAGTLTNAQHSDERIVSALRYARAMLTGDFVTAHALWESFDTTEPLLAALEEYAGGGASVRRWDDQATLAVVLPGSADVDYSEEIERHTVIGRSAWPTRGAPDAGTGTRTDVVFLNKDRFLDARQSPMPEDGPLFVTKRSCARHMPRASAGRIATELAELATPAGYTTYLIVRIATWAIDNFRRPATFYCADFYLGKSLYRDERYDEKAFLASVEDVRWSYLMHDVFFVHAIMSRWLVGGRLEARGRLKEILEIDGARFAHLMVERWGSADRVGALRPQQNDHGS